MRPDAYDRFGGDTTLVVETARALRALGVEADVVAALTPDPRGYDVAHVFNATQPDVCGPQVDACLSSGTPVALSTVWLDLLEFAGRGCYYHELAKKARDPQALERRFTAMRSRAPESFLSGKERARLAKALDVAVNEIAILTLGLVGVFDDRLPRLPLLVLPGLRGRHFRFS